VILALDLSGRCGWTLGTPGDYLGGGVVALPPIIQPGRMFNALMDWMCDALSGDRPEFLGIRPTFVCTEAPMELPAMVRCHMRTVDAYQQIGLAAVVDCACERYGVDCRQVPVLEARREILGKSRGWNKESIVAWTRDQDFDPVDDNEADSIVIWLYACRFWRPKDAAA
jgi:hypothetical protein